MTSMSAQSVAALLGSEDLLTAYGFSAQAQVSRFGNGHINRTFLFEEPATAKKLIVQQINTAIFPEPQALVNNASAIAAHLQFKQQAGVFNQQVLLQAATVDGELLAGADRSFRALCFIEGGRSIEVVETPEQAYAAALTFGEFAAALADFPAQQLHTVIPDFHNLRFRFSQLQQAIDANPVGRLASCQSLVDECLAQQPLMIELERVCAGLPMRVCHNDTKINNMLYSDELGRGIATIDLDTCMAGYWLFDFGDMVRTCCSPEPEDSLNTEQVRIRPEIFAALARGYLAGLGSIITDAERHSLLLGAKVMCLMIGVRFLTDHLNGDTYFAIHRPNHNLQRAENQLRLFRDLLAQQQELVALF